MKESGNKVVEALTTTTAFTVGVGEALTPGGFYLIRPTTSLAFASAACLNALLFSRPNRSSCDTEATNAEIPEGYYSYLVDSCVIKPY